MIEWNAEPLLEDVVGGAEGSGAPLCGGGFGDEAGDPVDPPPTLGGNEYGEKRCDCRSRSDEALTAGELSKGC